MPAPQRSRARSVLVLAVGLALVALPGFALGLLAGVGWEDPSLLISHLLGRDQEASWEQQADAPPEAPAELPDVAARPLPEPPPVPATPPAPVARAAPPAEAAPAPAAVETSAARARPEAPAQGAAVAGRFAVQVGAFGESRAAEELAQTLRGKGFAAYVSPGATAAATRWRVRVGPFPSRPAAEKAAGRLAAEEKLPTWVLDENGPA